MIEIFGSAWTRTRRCLWTAEECGADYVQHPIDLLKGGHKAAEYVALNPNARVPTMRHGDLVLFESAAICRYIAERHPQAGLLPEPGTTDAALHEQWMYWITGELEQALWNLGKHRFALPAEYRIKDMERVGRFEFSRTAKVLAAHMQDRTFILDETFRLADIMAGHTLNWARNFKVDFESQTLEEYLDRLLARPAFQRTLTMD